MNITGKSVFLGGIKGLAKKHNSNSPILNLNTEDFNKNFPPILENIFNNTYKIRDMSLDNLERCILVAYGFRNYGAHKLKESTLVTKNFNEIIQDIINVILFAIQTGYEKI